MEPANQVDIQELFMCKVCEFGSKNKNSIKINLLEHIDNSVPIEIENDDKEYANVKCYKTKTSNIINQFDTNGRPLHELDT